MELGELEYPEFRINLSELLTREPRQVRTVLPVENCRKNINKKKKKLADRRRKNIPTKSPVRAPLLIALGACAGIAVSRWSAIADSFSQLGKNKAIAQTVLPSPVQPAQSIRRPLEINLTISDPEDLKVKEGQQISKGDILSDRTKERDRLGRQKTMTENAIATLNNTQFLPPPQPQPIPAPQPLQPANYSKEEAAIASMQLKLRQAKQAYALELEIDPFRTGLASIKAAKQEWDGAIAKSRQAGEILSAIATIGNNDEIELEHRQHKLNEALIEESRYEAIYKQREAELSEAKHFRNANLAKLKDAIALAESALNQAQANYADARNNRLKEEREHLENQARRVQDINEAASIHASQKAAYQNSLLRKDQQLFNYRERLDAITLDLEKISVVRSRYDGVIRRVKLTNQSDNAINVVLVLVPESTSDRANPGTSGTRQSNPFNSVTGGDGTLTAPNNGGNSNPFNNIPN